MVTPD
jgi:hypothetical protein